MSDSTELDPPPSLLEPSVYPHPVVRVQCIETHISWVFLTGSRAYKVKKPVDLGFLDFSTLEKRRRACEEEVRLNRRLAPTLYLGVAALAGPVDRPRWLDVDAPGAGAAREYAVVMREFPQQDQLDRRFAAGRVHARELVALAQALARFHAAAGRAPVDGPWGSFEHVIAPMRDNFRLIEQRLTEEACHAALRPLREWTEEQADCLRDRFAERLATGRVREGHGDLHLSNLVVLSDAIVPFDCLEFSPPLRWIDVVSDVAFLVMDLASRGAGELAHVFASAYFEACSDYDGVRLLPFYVVYRSMVRAKVAAISHAQSGMQDATALARYRMHLDLARAVGHQRRPALLLMHGVSASGKSWLSSRMVGPLRGLRVRSDVERKRLYGLEPEERPPACRESELYGLLATRRTYARLRDATRTILETGYPAIVDATFLHAELREDFIRLAERLGVRWAILGCTAAPAVLRDRIERRIAERSDVSDADLPVLDSQVAALAPLSGRERARTVTLDTSANVDLDATAERVRDLLGLDPESSV